MKASRPLVILVSIILILAAVSGLIHAIRPSATAPAADTAKITVPNEDQAKYGLSRAHLARSFGQLPLLFVENQGQWDEQVAYAVQGSDKTLYFTEQGVTFALTGPEGDKGEPQLFPCFDGPGFVRSEVNEPAGVHRWAVKLDFLDANPDARPIGQMPDEAIISYFKGRQDDWHAGLPTYRRLVYEELWPGIDLVYEGTVNRLKYHFVVRPGADPNIIRLAYRGATEVSVNAAGQLQVSTPLGGFQDDAPVAYQEVDGARVPVTIAYVLEPAGGASQPYHFDLGHYDPSLPLVLDPAVLVYAGYVGGGNGEYPGHIAVDGAGAAYVVGETESSEATFPITVGPDLTYNGGNSDGFVVKINPQGSGLIYAGYVGGTNDDAVVGIDVDQNGYAYITGATWSDESSFPVSVGPDLTHNGEWDAFVIKINPAGTGLVYGGYIGGSDFDGGWDIAVDSFGNAYIMGGTHSTEASFPVTVGPDLSFNGSEDTFVAKVNPAGTALDYAGYIGGNDWDSGRSLALSDSGNAYVAGFTCSTEATFPVTIGPDLTFGGYEDGFVAKVNQAGSALVYAGYIGGISADRAFGIDVDQSGSAYITGSTESDEASFPVTVGPDMIYNGNGDAFVVKVNSAGTTLEYAGYIGGSDGDSGQSLAIDGTGNAYIAGETVSSEATFPVSFGPDLTFNGGIDSFVAVVNSAGTGLSAAGYIGGSQGDFPSDITIDSFGNVYVIGQTDSSESTFPVTVGPDLTFNGSYDVFVAKVAYNVVAVAADFTGMPLTGTAPLTVTFANLSTGDFDTCAWDFGDGGTSPDCTDPSYTYTDPGTYTVTLQVSGLGGSGSLTRTGYITVYQPVQAAFTAAPLTGTAPLTVTFANLSTGDFDTCAWDFGDGGTSPDCTDPFHTYVGSGNFTVTLTVSGLGGTDSLTRTGYITVYQPVEAAFTAAPLTGTAPLTVTFANLSTGDFDTCAWDFGDGGTSQDCLDPDHAYTSSGIFTVTLAVAGLGGTDTLTRSSYITVYQPVQADFTAVPTSGTPPLAVTFANLSTGDFNACQWDLGDGTTSPDCDLSSHIYTAPGVYTVTLTVSGPGGTDTLTLAGYITVGQFMVYLPVIWKP